MDSAMLILLLTASLSSHSISNQWIDLVINDDAAQGYAGSICSLLDKYSGMHAATPEHPFACVRYDDFGPASGTVVCTDTSAVFTTSSMTGPQGSLPISVTIEYTLVDRGVEIVCTLQFLQDVELLKPLMMRFNTQGWNTMTIENQTGLDESFPLDASTWFQRFSGSQMVHLTGGNEPPLLFVFPNVSKGNIWIEDYGQPWIGLLFFDTEPPRENCQGPDLHSLIPAGETVEYFVRISMDEYFAPVFISNHPYGFERTAAWILDELPFIHPDQGYIWGFSETSDGPEPVSAELIQLLEEHATMKMNWLILPDGILTPNRDSIWAEPGWESSWSHWHGTWRVSTEATDEYKQWLLNIQDGVYPWADRVRMGSHGYHHTPNADSSYGGFHEFITYEPWEHGERFRMGMSDIDDIGLDTNLVSVVRFPGHRTSLSGLWAVIDHGFEFYCNGWRLIDWFAGKQFRNQWITMYQTPHGRLWGSNTVWWGDYQVAYPCEYLSDVLERGKFALLGCHPISMLNGGQSPEAYGFIDSILTSMEQDYDNFGWLLPSEYGDYLEACYNISVRRIRSSGTQLSMEFEGAVPEGMTFCARLNPLDQVNNVTLDGVPLTWELRSNGRLFAVSGQHAAGIHTLAIDFLPMEVADRSEGFQMSVQNPCGFSSVRIHLSGEPPTSPIEVSLFDVSGRVVCSGMADFCTGEAELPLPESLPSGLYIVNVRFGNGSVSAGTIVLR